MSRAVTNKFICASVFVAILLVLGAYYIVIAHVFFENNSASEEPAQAGWVAHPAIVGGKDAFEDGYADGLVTIRPEVSTVTVKKEESVMVRLFITYQRREPAPEVVELRFNANSTAMYIPRDENSTSADLQTYLRVNDYVGYKPEVVRVREGETAEVWVTIELAGDFLRALDYNSARGQLGHKIDIPIDVSISERSVTFEVDPLIWVVF